MSSSFFLSLFKLNWFLLRCCLYIFKKVIIIIIYSIFLLDNILIDFKMIKNIFLSNIFDMIFLIYFFLTKLIKPSDINPKVIFFNNLMTYFHVNSNLLLENQFYITFFLVKVIPIKKWNHFIKLIIINEL